MLMVANLAYMHYEVYFLRNHFPGIKPYYTPLVFAGFDVMMVLMAFSLVSFKKRCISYTLSYIFILLVTVLNIGYSRFFHQYITVGAFHEVSNLTGTWWLQYVRDGLKLKDLSLLLSITLAIHCIRRMKKHGCGKVNMGRIFMACCILLAFHGLVGRQCLSNIAPSPYPDIQTWWYSNIGEGFQRAYLYNPAQTIANNGIVRTQVMCNLIAGNNKLELSQSDIRRIDEYVEFKNEEEGELIDSCIVIQEKPDIIFIMVESLMSLAILETIDGKAVMPNLNEIIQNDCCYSNLSMESNKGAGESSDAQVAYLTGILPLQEDVTVTHIIHNEVISLPQLLNSEKGYNTYMTVPTESGFWHQEEANMKYGIANMNALGSWSNDSLVFDSAIKEITGLKKPFFNIILTISMHGLYEEDDLPHTDFPYNCPSSFSREYKNYLKRCHYTDAQIGRFISHLKQNDQYKNSVIIITSDHEVKENSLAMAKFRNDKALPFIMVHTNASAANTTKNRMNQVDVYTSLLDLFGISTEWRGMGHSIFRNGPHNTQDTMSRLISREIILGDYFRQSHKKW